MGIWQRFTADGRKVVYHAQEEAQRFGEAYVSTEHLLLGVIREPDSAGATVIQNCGVSLNRVRAEIEKQLPLAEARPSQDMTLAPRAKRVIDLASDEARNLGVEHIGSEHLLLGLISEGDGLAGRLLAKLGLELDVARREISKHLEPREEPVVEEAYEEPGPVWARGEPAAAGYEPGVSEQLAEVLAATPELMDDPAALGLALGVLLPNHARERRLLVYALELRIPREIACSATITHLDVTNWAGRLQREIGITPMAALFTVRAWAAALGKPGH